MTIAHPNVFAVEDLSYEEGTDQLYATMYLARTCLDPEVECDPEDSLERFKVCISFSSREYSIKDITDHAGDVEIGYAPLVLHHFATEFDRMYASIGHECSPAEVQPFRFNVNL